jgi:hypothetical protein
MMKHPKKTYTEKLDVMMEELATRIAQLKSGAIRVKVESDIEYYQTIEAYMTAERRG